MLAEESEVRGPVAGAASGDSGAGLQQHAPEAGGEGVGRCDFSEPQAPSEQPRPEVSGPTEAGEGTLAGTEKAPKGNSETTPVAKTHGPASTSSSSASGQQVANRGASAMLEAPPVPEAGIQKGLAKVVRHRRAVTEETRRRH